MDTEEVRDLLHHLLVRRAAMVADITGITQAHDDRLLLSFADGTLKTIVVLDYWATQPGDPASEDDPPPPLSRDLSGDLDAIPSHRIGEEGAS